MQEKVKFPIPPEPLKLEAGYLLHYANPQYTLCNLVCGRLSEPSILCSFLKSQPTVPLCSLIFVLFTGSRPMISTLINFRRLSRDQSRSEINRSTIPRYTRKTFITKNTRSLTTIRRFRIFLKPKASLFQLLSRFTVPEIIQVREKDHSGQGPGRDVLLYTPACICRSK